MSRILAITDIHGCARTFQALLDKIALTQSDQLYLLGDYVDRGPDSKGVIDIIIWLQTEGFQVHCIPGNHEELMLEAVADPYDIRRWIAAGGKSTMDSFNAKEMGDIPQLYVDFLKNMPTYIATDAYIFVHAGLNFRREDPFADKRDMTWIRSWYDEVDYEWLGNRIVIHGHTPISRGQIRTQLNNLEIQQFIDIDNGCVFFQRAAQYEMGSLCAFDLTNRTLEFMEYCD
jgi:serine/threonine protein phosphatase 1